jgi:hypothetical protein
MRMVLAHPFARQGHAEAVADDVDLLRTGVVEHRANEAPQVGDVRFVGVREGRADRLIGGKVALIALVAEPPQLARRIAVLGEVLRQRMDAAIGIAGGRERRVVVAVQEDDRRARHRPRRAEAEYRLAERGIDDDGKVGRQAGADAAGGVRGAGERERREDGREQASEAGHDVSGSVG